MARQTMILRSDDPDRLNESQEAFARAYVELRNVAAAYRLAYPTNASTNIAGQSGSVMLRVPKIAARIDELRALAAAESTVRASELIRDLYDMWNADVNELIKLVHDACRHCYGVDFKYQWRDAAEFAKAVDRHMQTANAKKLKDRAPMPDIAGGFGYDRSKDPNAICPACYGEGVERVVAGDTTRLSSGARKLYKGVRLKADGSLEVLMHDKMAAADMIAKMLGAYKLEGKGLNPEPELGELDPEGLTQEGAQRAYLELTQR